MAAGGDNGLSATAALRLAAAYRPGENLTFRQMIRLARFRDRNPQAKIRQEFGEWIAYVTLPPGSRYKIGCLHRPDPDKLLDELGEYLARPG